MLTADPFNAKVHAFLNRVNHDRPAKIPQPSETDLKRFLEVVDMAYGYDIDLKNNVIIKLPPEIDYKGDLFEWHESNPGYYEIKENGKCKELWRDNVCVAAK